MVMMEMTLMTILVAVMMLMMTGVNTQRQLMSGVFLAGRK